MKKIIALSFLFASGWLSCKAQSAERQVIGSSGKVVGNGSEGAEFTIGEPITNTMNGGGAAYVTNGFHQGNLSVTKLNELIEVSASIFPNPTQGKIHLQFKEEQKNVSSVLFSIDGKILQSTSINGTTTDFDLSSYAEGTYYIKINNNSSFKIIKTK